MAWNRFVLVIACILAGSAVAMGAYQAHGLAKRFEKAEVPPADADKRIENCGVAVRYQMWHGLALLGVGVLGVAANRKIIVAPVLMLLGVSAFSGGLYEIVFRGAATHWAIVPSGGMLMMLGWIALAISTIRLNADRSDA